MIPPVVFRWTLTLLLGAGCLWARAAAPLLGHASVKVYTEKQGLPQNTVWALTRDQDGMVWAGTLHGIGRYDGRAWTVVPTPVPSAALWVNANAAGVWLDGTLWFGTRSHGLLLVRQGVWERIGRPEGLGSDNVNAALESERRGRDGKPILWVGTFGGGLSRREDGRWVRVPIPSQPEAARVFALLERPGDAGQAELWVATDRGVWILGASGWRPFPENARLPGPTIRAMVATRDGAGGTVWMGCDEGGIAAWNGVALRVFRPGVDIPAGPVHALLATPEGLASGSLLATVGEGAPLGLEDGQWQSTRFEGIPELQGARSLLAVGGPGQSHALYVGTQSNGICRWRPGGWRHVPLPGNGDPRVLKVLAGGPANPEDLWFGSQGDGVWRLQGSRWSHWTPRNGLPHATIRDLAWMQVRGHRELMAATNHGVARWDGTRWAGLAGGPDRFNTPRSLLVTRGPNGERLWVATRQGVMRWDGHAWTTLGMAAGLKNPSSRCLVEAYDHLGMASVWVGTDVGLFRQEQERFQAVPLPAHLAGTGVSALAWCRLPTGGRGLLVGTYGRGLGLLQPQGADWTWMSVESNDLDPLGGEVVLSFQQDGAGDIYAGTLRGMLRLRLQGNSLVWVDRYQEEDGLPSRECSQGEGAVDAQGRLWVGTADGAAFLDPASELAAQVPKPLVLLSARAVGPEVPLHQDAELPAGVDRVGFSYALVSHHREEDSHYRTQLVGLESTATDWVKEGRREFTGLPHGHYTLKVWARDYRSLESGPLAVRFSVRPPLYATWWARALEVLGLIGLALAGIRWRSRRLSMQNLALEREVRLRTQEVQAQKEALVGLTENLVELDIQRTELLGMVAHDLRNPLHQIGLSAELVLAQGCPDETRQAIVRIREAAGRMHELITTILSKAAIESGRLEIQAALTPLQPLVRSCLLAFEDRAQRKHQVLRQQVPVDLTAWVDGDRLREVLDNLVSNALKFSPEGARVQVSGEVEGQHVRLQVEDEGPGISLEDRKRLFQPHSRLGPRPTGGESSTGLGLSIVKGLVEAMGGDIAVECPPGRGSRFVLRLPRSGEGAS